MIWAIVILLGVICVVLYGQLNEINEKLGSILSSTTEIQWEVERPERERQGENTYEEPTPEESKRSEEERKRREEEEGRQRARTIEQIEKEWGGWRKAAVICWRYHSEEFEQEYVLLTRDRTYTVKVKSLWTEWEGKPGTEAEYATHPNSPSLYIRKRDGGFVEFDILEEKLRKSATHTPGVLFD